MSISDSLRDSVPLPAITRAAHRRRSKYPWGAMTEGMSFFVPDTPLRRARDVVSASVCLANRELAPKTFTLRTVADGTAWGYPGQAGVGVWRTE